jgi:hypothetical protein
MPGVISEEICMRILVPGRFIAALAILTAFLFLLPASTKTASARPIGWEDIGPPPPPDSGDNDGVVLKAPSLSRLNPGATQEPTGSKTVYTSATFSRLSLLGRVRWYMSMMRLDFWSSLLR